MSSNSQSSPYLSIVAVSRNDDHGGNLTGRMQAFASNIGELVSRHKIPVELVVVEWNPPSDRKKLVDSVQWPANEFAVTRIIEVSSEIHSRFQAPDKLPLHQMIGKNVGIRRAHSQFVLATNIDILFPDEFFAWLASRPLTPNTLYRATRYDVDKTVADIAGADSQLAACAKSIIAVNHRLGTSAVPLGTLRGSPAMRREITKTESNIMKSRLMTLIRLAFRPTKNKSHLQYHLALLRNELGLTGPLPSSFTNASGDFQMMDKASWDRIGGYWEYDGFILHLDTYLSYAAAISGIQQQILDFPIYHIDHAGSFVVQETKTDTYFENLKTRGLSYMNLEDVQKSLIQAKNERIYTNANNWGLAELDLPEVIIG